MRGDRGDVPREDPRAGLDQDELVDEAEDRIDDAETEFGPDAPPRGAAPGNPEAEEAPT